MPLGKEVADAYIEVHGDMNPFRRDLQGGEGDARDAGGEAGDEYAQAFEDHARKGLNSKWDSITKALYSNKKIDWDRALGDFDSTGLRDAHDKITEFFDDMKQLGAMNEDQWGDAQLQLNQVLRLRREEHSLNKLMVRDLESQKSAMDDLAMSILKGESEQQRFNKSFEGMFTANQLGDMEKDWKALTRAMNDSDFGAFTKAEEDLDKWSARMDDVIVTMLRLRRVSESNAESIRSDIADFVEAENRRRSSIAASKKEMDDFKDSFTDFAQKAKRAALDKDFKALAEAVSTDNWSAFAKNYKTVDAMKKRIEQLTESTKEWGGVSVVEADRIRRSFAAMQRDQKNHGVELERSAGLVKALEFVVNRVQKAWSRTDSTVRLVTTLIAAAAGPVAALASGLAGAGTALVSSLGLAAGSIVPIIAGLGGVGIAIGLMVKSMAGVREEFPRIQTSIDRISQSWQDSADAFGAAWGPSFDEFMDRIATVIFTSQAFGDAYGQAAARVTDALTEVVNGPGMSALMDAVSTTLPAAAEGFGVGFAGVMNGIVNLMAGAAPVAALLGDDFARWGTALGEALSRGRESGELQAVFEAMRESLLAVLDFIGSVGSALGTLFMLGSTSGNSMLTSLTEIVDQFNAWMQTAEGATAVTEWFRDAEAIMRSLAPLAVGLGTALGMLVNPQSIGHLMELSTQLGDLLPKIAAILDAVSQSGLLNIFVDALGAIADAVTPLLDPLARLGQAAGPALQGVFRALGPLFAGVLSVLAPVIEGFARMSEVIGPQLGPAIQRISEALAPVMAILGDFVGLLSGLLVPVLQFIAETVINAVVDSVEGLSKVFTGLVDLVKNLFSGDFSAAWDSLVQIVSGALEAAWGIIQLFAYTRLLSFLGGIVKQVPGLFSKAFGAVKTAISDALAAIPGILTTFFSSLPGQIIALAAGIGTAAFQAFQQFGTAIGDFFSGLWTTITESIGTFWAGFTTAMTTGGTQVTDFFTGLVAGVVAIWDTLTLFFAETWLGITTAFQTAFTTIGLAVTVGWTYITTLFSTAWATIQAVVQTGIDFLANLFGPMFEAVVLVVQAGWDAIVLIFSTVWAAIQQVVAAALLVVIGLVTGDMGRVAEAINAAWTNIQRMFVEAGAAIYKTISEAWNNLLTATTEMVVRVQQYISDAWAAISLATANFINDTRNGWNGFWEDVGQNTRDAVANVQKWIADAWNNIKASTKQAFTDMALNILSSWNNIKATIRDALIQAVAAILRGWNDAKTNTRQAFLDMVNAVTTAMSDFRQRISQGIADAIGFFRELPGRIYSALSNVQSELQSIGTNMILGLITGIQGMAQRAINAVADVVGGAIDWAEKLLGIASPSKVFAQMGKYVGQGFSGGMESEANHVRDAAASMVEAATSPFDASAMYVAGKDAALGLADGLNAGGSLLDGALKGLTADLAVTTKSMSAPIGNTFQAVDGARASGNQVIVEKGGSLVSLQSNASDSGILANKVLGELDTSISDDTRL